MAIVLVTLALPAAAAPLVFPLRDQDGFPLDNDPPSVTAASWILYDQSSETVLGEWDADSPRPMASITKIMTVLLAIENGDLDEMVTVSEEAAGQGGQEIGLVAGETRLSRGLGPGGDDQVGQRFGGGHRRAHRRVDRGFVAMMNDRAAEMGMANTHFSNPNGLDTAGHYSTARDMLLVSLEAMAHPEFEELARSRAMVFPDTPDGTPRTASNTNRILNSYEGTIGVKTGETPNAGLTYVGAAERDGRRLFVVVLRSVGQRAHFADAVELFDWAYDDLRIQGTDDCGSSIRAPVSPCLHFAPAGRGRIETYLHTASSGVTADPPRPPGAETAPEPPPEIEITRTTRSGARLGDVHRGVLAGTGHGRLRWLSDLWPPRCCRSPRSRPASPSSVPPSPMTTPAVTLSSS